MRSREKSLIKLQNLVTKRISLVIGIFVTIVLCVLALDAFNANILSSTRAYITAEGYYSKSQKNAVSRLQGYASSREPAEYDAFLKELSVPLGDQLARTSLQQDPPDLARAREGFLAARNHPDDVDDMIDLFLNFQHVDDMKRAIDIWTLADADINALLEQGQQLKQELTSAETDDKNVRRILNNVAVLNERLAGLEDSFTFTLGDVARRVDEITRNVSLFAAALLLSVGVLLSAMIIRGINNTQRQLQISEARFRGVVESNIIGIMFWQKDGQILDANNAFFDCLGYRRDELQALNWNELLANGLSEDDHRAMQQIETQGYSSPYEITVTHKEGHPVPVLIGSALSGDETGNVVSFVLDISSQRKLEQQLMHAKRMEAVGTLVGGIAHDFNNTLTAVFGNIDLAAKLPGIGPEMNDHLNKISTLCEHSASIVKQLMIFARKDVVNLESLPLRPFFKGFTDLANSVTSENIAIETSVPREELIVTCDETQIQQMMLSLFNNAREALEGVSDPKITFELKRFEPDAEFQTANPHVDATSMAQLSVSDNGKGMSPTEMEQIFEPFYTTKGIANNQGLGLAMTYGAVQTHGGVILVSSEAGAGTTVSIFLPLSEGTIETET